VEVSVLLHYFPVNALKDVVQFVGQDELFSKASVTAVLDKMAGASSQRIFLKGTVKNGLSTFVVILYGFLFYIIQVH